MTRLIPALILSLATSVAAAQDASAGRKLPPDAEYVVAKGSKLYVGDQRVRQVGGEGLPGRRVDVRPGDDLDALVLHPELVH